MHADVAILFAKTDPNAWVVKGVTCFWLPLDIERVSRSLIVHTGMKTAACSSIFLENVRIHQKYRVGGRR